MAKCQRGQCKPAIFLFQGSGRNDEIQVANQNTGSKHPSRAGRINALAAPMRAAIASAFCIACVFAMPRPAISYAVPCAGVVIATGRPPWTVTPRSKPINFIAI